MKQIKLAKHSALIQMTNTMTAEQRKIYNYLIFEAKEQLRENPKRTVFEVEIWNICKYTGAQNNFHIKQSVKAMESITVKVNTLGKDKKRKWEPFNLLEEVIGMEDESGFITYALPQQVIETIYRPEVYGEIDLAIVKGLKSKYAIAMYEFITDYIKITTIKIKIDEFKTLMGIDPQTQYQRFFDFKKRVIESAIDEINSKTSIITRVEPIHRGRKVVALQFFFRYRDESLSERKKLSKTEEFTRYRQAIYAHASGRPIFVYKNRNIIVDMHPTKEKIMVGYQGEGKMEWFSNEEALVVWNILKQNRVVVDEKLYEYHCGDLPF